MAAIVGRTPRPILSIDLEPRGDHAVWKTAESLRWSAREQAQVGSDASTGCAYTRRAGFSRPVGRRCRAHCPTVRVDRRKGVECSGARWGVVGLKHVYMVLPATLAVANGTRPGRGEIDRFSMIQTNFDGSFKIRKKAIRPFQNLLEGRSTGLSWWPVRPAPRRCGHA